jgi:hypothetical protein
VAPLPAGIALPDVSVTLPLVLVKPPVHVVARFGTAASVTPAGSVSVRAAASVAGTLFALVSVSVRVAMPFALMVDGANPLASVGAAVSTTSIPLAGAALLPFEVMSAPAASVFV